MAPRDSQLPEGTDHIINGAMETGDMNASTGSSGGRGSSSGTGSNFIGSETGTAGDGTGGAVTRTSGSSATGTSPLRDGVANLRGQATDRVRQLADDGKARATDTLDEFSKIIEEAAGSIEERLGGQYGTYARRAADAVSGFAGTLREREVDELYQDARGFVRKSPGLAIGAAAAAGFVLVRLIKAGMAEQESDTPARKTARKGGRPRADV